MVRIVELQENEEPPLGEHWVLVTSEGWNGDAVEGRIDQHELGATFLTPEREPDFSTAIDRAISWAEEHALPTVYVQRRFAGIHGGERTPIVD